MIDGNAAAAAGNGSQPHPSPTPDRAVVENLTNEVTAGYVPQMPLEAMWQVTDGMPRVTLRRDLYFMQLHPIVINGLEYYRSGISGAEFWGGPDHANPANDQGIPISPNPKVAQFALAMVERFWRIGVPALQEEGYPHGWCPGEHMYKEVEGMLAWSHLKVFHPTDGHILTDERDYTPIGVRIRNVRRKPPIDLHLASNSVPAKGCWYAHRPRAGSLYGRSQLTGAWLPWRMLAWRDGIDQVINAAIYRAGYVGPKVRYPPGSSAPTNQTGVPATRLDGMGGARRDHRDVARQIIEIAKAGAGVALSSEQWPQAQGGGFKWDVEFPTHVMNVGPLIDGARWCEDRIMLGIGVPPELVKASQTGSGYSGRSIPREAFLDGQQKVADALLMMFVEQVLKPLVLWNFGDVPFSIQVKSLLKTQSDDKQGEEQGEGQQPGANGKPMPKPAANEPPTKPDGAPTSQPAPALGMEHYSRVMGIVRNVVARRAA